MTKELKFSLKFRPQYIDAILSREKIVTSRLFFDKDFAVGDIVDLINSENGEKFVAAKILNIKSSDFASLVKGAKDIPGTYEMYKEYYKREIKPTDEVKYITFEILN